MIYLNENHIHEIGIQWEKIIQQIENAVKCLKNEDFAQPIKPYLRYKDLKNRIIAMPAFVGGGINVAGIKWIASFPDNIQKGIPRAHSVVILNDADTGTPYAIINTALLSIIRTATVSGIVTTYFDKFRPLKDFKLGIIGWGPIGQYHFKMLLDLFGEKISLIKLFDLRTIDRDSINPSLKDKVRICDSWKEAYEESDVIITCTVSKETYIDIKPKVGALLLNISLRDYKPNIYDYVKKSIIVDDWDEVCRENTDIENMYKEKGLKKEDTKSIIDVVCRECIKEYKSNEAIMFNPMGMAVFDIAVADYYCKLAMKRGIGQRLE